VAFRACPRKETTVFKRWPARTNLFEINMPSPLSVWPRRRRRRTPRIFRYCLAASAESSPTPAMTAAPLWTSPGPSRGRARRYRHSAVTGFTLTSEHSAASISSRRGTARRLSRPGGRQQREHVCGAQESTDDRQPPGSATATAAGRPGCGGGGLRGGDDDEGGGGGRRRAHH